MRVALLDSAARRAERQAVLLLLIVAIAACAFAAGFAVGAML